MTKKIIAIFLVLLIVCAVSGCGENYPYVEVHNAIWGSVREILIGKPYTYNGFDVENTDGGKDLILHFTEGEG